MLKRAKQPSGASDWRPISLRLLSLAFLAFVELGIIATIVALLIVSRRDDGFADAAERSFGSFLSVPLDSSLLWTALPPLLMAIFALGYGEMVAAAASRQPFVELNKDCETARSVRKTILLDYASYPAATNWFVALRYKHWHLSISMLAQLLATLVLAPLTSNVFREKSTQRSTSIETFAPNRINLSALNDQIDLQPALDMSMSVLAYRAVAPLWIQGNASIEPFYTRQGIAPGDVTSATFAISVQPGCRIIEESRLNMTARKTDAPGYGTVSVNFVDRDCEIDEFQWSVGPTYQRYVKSKFQPCSGNQDPQDRIIVFAGTYSPDAEDLLSNISVVSCWPEYWNTSIVASIASEATGPTLFHGFQSGITSRLMNLGFRLFHSKLADYKLSGVGRTVSTDGLGNVVSETVKNRVAESSLTLDADAYLDATEDALGTIWAATSALQLLRPLVPLRTVNGTLTTSRLRVQVVEPIAYVLIALLVVMTTSTFTILIHVLMTASILTEEPQGLLGRALLLARSDVMSYVENLRVTHGSQTQLLEYLKKWYSTDTSMCWFDWNPDGRVGRIRLAGLNDNRKPRKRWWRRCCGKWPWSLSRLAGRHATSATPASSSPQLSQSVAVTHGKG